MVKEKIKLGLLLNSYNVPIWIYRTIENIQNSEYAEIDLVILNNNLQTDTESSTKSVSRSILETLYSKIIERHTYLPDAYQQKDCSTLLDKANLIKVVDNKDSKDQLFSDAEIEEISNNKLDVIFHSGCCSLQGDILKAARYGVWSYVDGDHEIKRGGPAGFWESMLGWPATGSSLQILTDNPDGGKVLCQSLSCTDSMSIKDNNSGVAWKSISFVTRQLLVLYNLGGDAFFEQVKAKNLPSFYSEKKFNEATDYEFAKLLFFKLVEKIRVIWINKFYFNQWILLFDIKEEFSSSLWRYKKIIPPKDRFWADPHVIYKDEKYYIFIEELIYKNKNGHLSVITMDKDGNYDEPVKIMEKPYHLSYPFVFLHEGKYFMIPETMDNETIDLYICTEFPNKWEYRMTLMENVKAVDATVIYYHEKWWMFANMVETEGASSWDELFLFSSDDIFSQDWKPHPMNPIVSDCSTSRPAGKIFIENGMLIRPSQNCSNRYGYGLNLNKITVLDENTYCEETVSQAKPDWDNSILGTHTFSRENSLHVIDGVYRRRK